MAVPACTDDHFDVQEGGSGIEANITSTLWDEINSRDELSKFASIIEKTPYFKDEDHPVIEDTLTQNYYTYAEVLSGTSTYTVFAPTNDAISDDEYAEYMRLLDGTTADKYDVYLRFVGNHIVQNSYRTSAGGEDIKIHTINGKKAEFSPTTKTLKGIGLIDTNIGAINGVLHTIGTQSDFAYNIYEYIKANGATYGELRAWLLEHDTILFNPNASVEVGSNENGDPVYIDSVYYRYNLLYGYSFQPSDANPEWMIPHKGWRASLESEDSTYAMVLPTDAAWKAAYAKLAPYYKYATAYVDKSIEDESEGKNKNERLSEDTAVLKYNSLRMDLASTLLFNVRQQPRTKDYNDYWTAEKFLSTSMPKMFNTRLDTFRVKEAAGDVKSILFDNNTNPIKASNGILVPVNNWNFMNFEDSKDVEVKVNRSVLFNDARYNATSTLFEQQTYNNATSKLTTDSLLGSVSDNYFYLVSYGTSVPTIYLKLYDNENNRQVMSGIKYEVQVVMVPTFFANNKDSIVTDNNAGIKKNEIRARIKYLDDVSNTGAPKEKETGTSDLKAVYEGNKVDTLTLGTIEFPYSYKNIRDSYPVISLTTNITTGIPKDERVNYQPQFAIDKIILKAKEE